MSLKPFDSHDLQDPEAGDSSFAQGATGMHKYDTRDLSLKASKNKPQASVKNPKLLLAAVVILALVLVGVIVFAVSRLAGSGSGAASTSAEVTVIIPSGAGDGDIAQILQDAGVISSTTTFMNAVSAASADGKLRSGTYHLQTGSDTSDVVSALLQGPAAITLTIPEGFTVAQTAARVEAVLGIAAADFINQAKASNYATDYSFLLDTYNDSLEGFLYPETYQFDESATADTVIRTMLNQFATVTSTLDFSQASQGNTSLTQYQVLILASLIEKETAVSSERTLVSSVIYNRLNAGWYLQIDAAIAYALNKYDLLTYEDLTVDSPYNVYTNFGLPPGPICSPSLESINAAIHPDTTDYFFYVASAALDGTHVFAATEEEFNANRDAYNAAVYGSGGGNASDADAADADAADAEAAEAGTDENSASE